MNHKKLQVWLPFFLSVAMVTGMFLGYKLRGNMPATGNMFSQPGVSPMREVMELIRNRYVDDVNPDSLGQAAIESMLTQLDPHSVYIPASDLSDVNDDLNGRFEGIGVEFNIFDDTVHVLTVLKDGPSDKAGLRAGDRFLRVGDSVVAGRKIGNDGIRNLLRGPGGSKVAVTMLRDGSEKNFTITRGYIPLSSLDAAYMLTATTGYIRLNKFSENTYEDFMKNLEELQKKGMKELVLDLRDNGGGILEEAVEMADEFIGGDTGFCNYPNVSSYNMENPPPKDSYCLSLMIYKITSNISYDQFVFPNGKKENIIISGMDAVRLTGITTDHPVGFTVVKTLLKVGNKMFVFNYSGNPIPQTEKDVAEKIINSFTIK